MSPSQSQSGRAFEYAVVSALQSVVGEKKIFLKSTAASILGVNDFASLETSKQANSLAAAASAIKQLLLFEPHLSAAAAGMYPLQMWMQSDQAGGEGDVRDIIIEGGQQDWQIGISAKHQHEALKHSRLSQRIDFGKQWFGHPCSADYFREIEPIFVLLNELRSQKALWSAIADKDNQVYIPVLNAFRSELLRLDSMHVGIVAARLVQYLIGTHDFYKIIKLARQTKLQVYNFNGTLNQNFGKTPPQVRLDRLKLPTRIVELDFKRDTAGSASTTTLELICNGGWQLSFRVHNASSRVEPSLKFDINLVGRPNNLQTFSLVT